MRWRNRDRCRNRRPFQSWSPPASVRSPDAHPRSNRFQNTAYTFPRSAFKINLLSAFCAGLSMWNPRAGGEKILEPSMGVGNFGSPPAWAGKSRMGHELESAIRWNPRVGGEKPNSRRMSSCRVGSPPHRRGKVLATIGHNLNTGITPAWAGKSCCGTSCSAGRRDHPRVGGEKGIGACTPMQRWGSPPRGRGKGLYGGAAGLIIGITPAWAGKRH